jgi:PAS domain S-box-containing protein
VAASIRSIVGAGDAQQPQIASHRHRAFTLALVGADYIRTRAMRCGSALGDLRLDPALSDLPEPEIKRLCVENLLGSPDHSIFFKDRDSRFVLVSGSWLARYAPGHTLAEVIGKTDFDFFSEKHAVAALAHEKRVLETGEPIRVKAERETFHDRPDSWAQTTKAPLRDERGEIVGTWGTSRDITAQVHAEQALEDSRKELLANDALRSVMFESNPQPIYVYERGSLAIVGVNNAGVAIYGYPREELLTMKISELVAPESLPNFFASLQVPLGAIHVGFRPAQSRRHRYKDGTIVDVEVTSNDAVLDGRPCIIASVQDVTARTRAAMDLAMARDEAVEASNMKSAFLANVSHEIRTPMNGVLGMTELLLDTKLDEEQRLLATQVASSGELMIDLINDILDISKIEAGQLDLEVTDFALREAIENACDAAKRLALAKGLEFAVDIAAELPEQARGDGRRLRQILLNLVSNAVKFTSEGKIAVAATTLNGPERGVRIEVTDSGIGIDPAVLDRMFEPFTQADVSTTRNYGGTGLGLAIASELSELMGGTIGAESAVGSGSTFWIELPLAVPASSGGDGSQRAPASGTANKTWSSAPLVLVAEDSRVNQIVAVRTLERCGCRTEVVGNGQDALDALAKQHYDAVLMDCRMPGLDGYEATTELRRREAGGPRTPVVAMTADAMKGTAERCLAAGMDGYLTKPIHREQLVDALHRLLPTHR